MYNGSMDTSVMSRTYLLQVANALVLVNNDQVERAVETLRQCRNAGGIAWIIGNGGSAATASHFANDLFKMGRLRAVPLADLTPLTTAYGNDHGWKSMYAEPLKGLMGAEDVLVAISCSGVSPNIVEAAREVEGGRVIVLTGKLRSLNTLAELGTVVIGVPSGDIRIQEDVHLAICHAIAGILKESD